MLVHSVIDDLMDFMEDLNENESDVRPYMVAVMGEMGSGKTLFAKCLLDSLKRKRDFMRDDSIAGHGDYKPIYASALNAESQMKFLAAWRPIVQSMLYTQSLRAKKTAEEVMAKYTKSFVKDEIFDVILDIFNMGHIKQGGLSLPLCADPYGFVKREKYSDDIVDNVLDFMVSFF